MTHETIENEIAEFNDKFFSKYYDLIDFNFDFMQEYSLHDPKENYFLTLEFLNVTIHHFTNLDFSFYKGTFKKLHRDINNLYKIYQKFQENEKNVEKIFDNNFLPRNNLFKDMHSSLVELQKPVMLDEYERETKDVLNQHYKEMKEIYKEFFMEDFTATNKEVMNSLAVVLNSKIYYLDKLLWLCVLKSEIIMHTLKSLKITKNISSKKYIQQRLSVALPYSENYKYMQKCLRIYK